MGMSARKKSGQRGTGAIAAGVLAIILAVSMTCFSVSMMKQLKETAVSSGVAPTISRYMDDPYLGLSFIVINAANDSHHQDAVKTIRNELDALKKYVENGQKPAAKNTVAAG